LKIFEEARVWTTADKISVSVNPVNPAYGWPILILRVERKRESGLFS
jgi:hypothetical protein